MHLSQEGDKVYQKLKLDAKHMFIGFIFPMDKLQIQCFCLAGQNSADNKIHDPGCIYINVDQLLLRLSVFTSAV